VSVRETELRSLLLQQRLRNAGRRLPPAFRDFARMLAAAAVGFGILTELLAWLTPVEPMPALAALALLFAAQATSYAIKLARDPDYEVPGCGCGTSVNDDSTAVLRSPQSRILGVPISAYGVLLYAGLLAVALADLQALTVVLALAAGFVSLCLGYVMVARLASVCTLCVNVAALNLLILLQLLR
jgi:uncharacterized membrane protein